MSRLNPKIDSPWDLLLIVSGVGALVAAYFAFVPPAKAPDRTASLQHELKKSQTAATKAKGEAEEAEQKLKLRIWDVRPQDLSARVMDSLTALSERRKLTVANFSSGRSVIGAGLRQIPFVVTLEGTFTDIQAALEDLERPEARLAIGNVSISPREIDKVATGRVAATLTLTAFLRQEEQP